MNLQILLPLLLTLLAGMSTLLGGFMTFFVKRDSLKVLSIGLGFSAGVMIYISLTELMKSSEVSWSNPNFQSYAIEYKDIIGIFTLLPLDILI